MNDATKYIPRSTLKREHGFSDRLIRELLGDPDGYEPNPVNPRFAPVPVYALERVQKAKRRVAWKRYQPTRERLAEAAQKRQAKKREETKEWAETVPIHWRKKTPKDAAAAINSGYYSRVAWNQKNAPEYGDFYEEDWREIGPIEEIPQDVLRRWAVNFLRHKKLAYESRLRETKGKTGKDAAYYVLKRRCLAMIAERYPEFAEECEAQNAP